jgi:hypothetical protein
MHNREIPVAHGGRASTIDGDGPNAHGRPRRRELMSVGNAGWPSRNCAAENCYLVILRITRLRGVGR